MGSVIFITGLILGRIWLTKSFGVASSAMAKTDGNTNGTIVEFTNSFAKHGTTLCTATLKFQKKNSWNIDK